MAHVLRLEAQSPVVDELCSRLRAELQRREETRLKELLQHRVPYQQ